MQKKGMAIGAKHKKSGAKSKVCRFPSDYLTKKEREALNGEVTTWNFKNFCTCDEFVQMPHDIKEGYINYLINTYHVGLPSISLYLFKKSENYLFDYAKHNSLHFVKCSSHGRAGAKYRMEFIEAIGCEKSERYIPTPEAIKESVKNIVGSLPKKPSAMINYAEFTFHGGIDYEALNTIVSKFTNGNVKIHIRIQKED